MSWRRWFIETGILCLAIIGSIITAYRLGRVMGRFDALVDTLDRRSKALARAKGGER